MIVFGLETIFDLIQVFHGSKLHLNIILVDQKNYLRSHL